MDGEHIIFDISRGRIESGDVKPLAACFNAEKMDRTVRRDLFGAVTWSFSGYDNEAVELYGIPQVRNFLALANRDTMLVAPIASLVKRHLWVGSVSVDPFARNCEWATHTNDLNPRTKAQYHMEALDFLLMLRARQVKADVVIFDPPYNPGQAKECYEELGFLLPQRIAQTAGAWAAEKDVVVDILKPDGVFLWFGWNSCAMGVGRGYEIAEIMLVTHGRGKHDTICVVERMASPATAAQILKCA